jgi:transposase
MQNDTLIAVDLAKSVFEIGVSHHPGKINERQRPPREKFLAFFVNRPPAVVIMEACSSAHFWARKIGLLSRICGSFPVRAERRGYEIGRFRSL